MTVDSPLEVTTTLGGAQGDYRTDDINLLYSGVLLAGKAVEVQGSHGLRVASFDFDEDTLRRVVELERRATAALEQQTGARQPLAMVCLHRVPEGVSRSGELGVNVGDTVTVLATDTFDGTATSPDGFTLLHELTHSSLPGDGNVPHWIGEGYTDYFALRVGLALDGMPPEALREVLSNAWNVFVEECPTRQAGKSMLADYFGGMVLAHCIDVRLRRDGSSLEAVLFKARARGNGRVTNDLWEQEIALASSSAGARIVSARREPLDPPSDCFTEERYVRRPTVRSVAPSYLRAVLGIAAVDDDPKHTGVVITQVDATSRLRAGDRVAWLDGQRVVSLAHLLELLTATSNRSTVRLDYVRAGKSAFIDVAAGRTAPQGLVPLERQVWLPASSKR